MKEDEIISPDKNLDRFSITPNRLNEMYEFSKNRNKGKKTVVGSLGGISGTSFIQSNVPMSLSSIPNPGTIPTNLQNKPNFKTFHQNSNTPSSISQNQESLNAGNDGGEGNDGSISAKKRINYLKGGGGGAFKRRQLENSNNFRYLNNQLSNNSSARGGN
jgi:hypothetical protein